MFRLKLREKDYISDRRRIGQQHNKSVDADAFPGCRGHAVFERLDEVEVQRVELATIALVRAVRPLPGVLQMGRVVLLGPVVAAFHAGDEDLEAFHEARVLGHRLGKG